jgi:hypothetical protein
MAYLDDWLPLVRPPLPGLPDFIGTEATREAAIEFCRRTKLFRESIALTTSPGEAEYPSYSSGNTVADRIDDILRDGAALEPASREVFHDNRWDRISGAPSAYYLEGNRAIVLGPIPDTVETLSVRAIMRPAADAETLDDALWDDWRWVIAAGARAHIRRNSSSWIDTGLLEQDDGIFQDGIEHAIHRRARGQTRHRLRVPGHYF